MGNSFKKSWLSLCLLASLAMVGCGGGGGGSKNNSASLPYEALVAKAVISPILQNANAIIKGGVVTSYRYSTNDTNTFSTTDTNKAIVSAIQTPDFLRAVICAVGGNIEGGLWVNESRTYSYCEVATYSNGVYERTVYCDNPDDIIKNGVNSYGGTFEDSIVAYYKIEDCYADYDKKNKIIKSLKINSGAKITVDEKRGFYFGKKDDIYGYKRTNPIFFKGSLNTDLEVKWEEVESETFKSPKVFDISGYSTSNNSPFPTSSGKDITNEYKNYKQGLQTSKKITSKTTYTFTKFEMNLTDLKLTNYPSLSGTPYEYKGNLNISINGIKGNIVANKSILVDVRLIQSDGNGWHYDNTEKLPYYNQDAFDYQYDEETGEESETFKGDAKLYYGYWNAVSVKKPEVTLKYASPVTIALSGNLTDYTITHYNWETGKEARSGEGKYSGSIKNVTIKANNISGDFDSLVISDADASIETGDYKTEAIIKIGDKEVYFNSAKINITGLKYDYRWKPTAEKYTWVGQIGYMNMEKSQEYTKELKEMYNKCFSNTKVNFEAEESKNNISITGECDISKKTATVHIDNKGNYIVKDDSDPEKIMEFNFKTLDIEGTKVDVLADNNCEGAELKVTGVEKDDLKTTSTRTYKVINGKLVLQSADDKKVPNMPDVEISEIPEELSDTNSIIDDVKDANPSETVAENLKVGKKGDLSVAKFNREKSSKIKKIETNISAKNKIIAAISFFGDNEYTLVFVIDYKNEKHPQIKGSIFRGKITSNITIDTVENRIGQFAGKDGKITVVTADYVSKDINVQ